MLVDMAGKVPPQFAKGKKAAPKGKKPPAKGAKGKPPFPMKGK